MLDPSRLLRRTVAVPDTPVVMVIPPSGFLLDERVFMSLGILKVAAVLEKAGGRVEMLDLSGISNYVDAVLAHMAASKAKHVCLTATTPQMPAVAKIVEALRAVRSDVVIVLGGPHPTLTYAAKKLEQKASRIARAHRAMEILHKLADVVVAGDGELAIAHAIAPEAPRIIDADDRHSALFLSNADYEETPMPARHLIDVGSYHYTIDGANSCSVIAQLGCPYMCSFCGGRSSSMLRKIRMRSTGSILSEMEHLHKTYGFTGFMFSDDELNVSKSVVELMRGIAALAKRLGTEFRLRGFVKAERFTAEQAESMYAAGFRWLLCGFEAADERILENIQKKATIEDNTRVVELCRQHGLKVKALMSVGHAGESEKSILAVRDWLVRVKPADFDCTVISTYPGTPYYDEAVPHETLSDVWTYTCKKSGDRLHAYDIDYSKVADYYKGDPNGGYQSYVFTDHLESKEIVRLRDQVESEVRSDLGIPFNPGAPGIKYEHSMGAGNINQLPAHILRTTT